MKATECFHSLGQRHASLLEKKESVTREKGFCMGHQHEGLSLSCFEVM